MQAILNYNKKQIELKEFDKNLSLDELNQEFGKVGYSQEFLNDLRAGFETSETYTLKNESNRGKRDEKY